MGSVGSNPTLTAMVMGVNQSGLLLDHSRMSLRAKSSV